MEKEITLRELSDRHPEVEKDVAKVEFKIEVHLDQTSPDDGGWSLKKVVRDVTIGLIVGIATILLTPYVMVIVP